MYKHRENLTHLVPHHSAVESVSMDEKGSLSLTLSNGLWVTDKHPRNPYGAPARTDKACLLFEEVATLWEDIPDSFALHILWNAQKSGRRSARTVSGYPDITDYITSSRAALELTDLFERNGFFLLRGRIALPTGKAGDFFWEIPATRLLCLWNDLCPQ